MEFSARMLATAYKLTVKYGTSITLHKPPAEALYENGARPYWLVDDVKTYTPPAGVQYAGIATVHSPRSSELLDGRIHVTDSVFKCVQIPEPDTRDQIEWLGDKYTVLFVSPSVVQGTKILYTVYCRLA